MTPRPVELKIAVVDAVGRTKTLAYTVPDLDDLGGPATITTALTGPDGEGVRGEVTLTDLCPP